MTLVIPVRGVSTFVLNYALQQYYENIDSRSYKSVPIR